MGEVYKARDTRLDRTVAIKILPEHVADDPDRRRRFEQEARAVSGLNHAHICTLYDIGTTGAADGVAGSGVHYLVMEYVEGQTLAERLAKGSVPRPQALEYATQIADALASAHQAGVVHRDLKPGNIMLTKAGVKLLDFGLAKLKTAPAGAAAASELLTRNPTTTPGSVLGTVQYMAPEQLEGKEVDARADLWAFGCVLYEMTTGRQAFEGKSHASLIAAIMEHEPPAMRTLDPMSPPALEHLVGRCLAKDPDERWQSARDVLHELQWVAEAALPPGAPGADAARPRRALLPWLAAAFVALAGAAWVGYVAWPRPTAPRESQQLAIVLPANQEFVVGGQTPLAFSPDGGTLVFLGGENGRRYLFRRSLSDRKVTAIPGTDDGAAPFFSPDGHWIGFSARNHFVKVPAEGGQPVPIARGGFGAVWLTDGTIVYTPVYTEGLFRVSAEGGVAQRLTTPDRAAGELGHWWPDILPGERFVIFTAYRTPIDRSRIGILDLQTRKIVRWIVDGGYFARYVPTGHLLYVKGHRLYALPFDPANAMATGAAVLVLGDVLANESDGFASYAVSQRGALAYITQALGNPARELVWLDREGHNTPATNERRAYLSAKLSPDGRQAAMTVLDESADLWTLSFEHGTLSRLTSSANSEGDPGWSHDGRELFYVVSTPDHPPFEPYRMEVGKPDSGRPIWNERVDVDTIQMTVSPDGRTLAFTRQEPETGRDVYTRALDGSTPASRFRATGAEEQYPSFSPDGRWIAYESDETGRPEIYADPFAAVGGHVQVSSDGGAQPIWAKNGEIFYRSGADIRVVRTRLTKGFEFDAPRVLFHSGLMATSPTVYQSFDVTADGKRILAVTIPEASRPRQIDVLLDWTAMLARQKR